MFRRPSLCDSSIPQQIPHADSVLLGKWPEYNLHVGVAGIDGQQSQRLVTDVPAFLAATHRTASHKGLNIGIGCRTCVVETMGLEPTTPALQRQCSSQLSYVPK